MNPGPLSSDPCLRTTSDQNPFAVKNYGEEGALNCEEETTEKGPDQTRAGEQP